MRIFTPEQNTSADAYKFDYRIYYDVFVKASAADSLWAWISAPVTIDMQPADVTTAEGAVAETLSVTASTEEGSTLTYQWYKCETATGKGAAKLAEETSASYKLPADLAAGEHYYFCKITADGFNTVKTDVVKVTVE
jgi:hypothetical protein